MCNELRRKVTKVHKKYEKKISKYESLIFSSENALPILRRYSSNVINVSFRQT